MYFDLKFGADALVGLKKMQQIADGYHTVVGIGHSLLSSLAREIPGLPVFTPLSQNGIDIPSTPAALWCWLRGDDPGEVLHLSRKIVAAAIADEFSLRAGIDAFRYGGGRGRTTPLAGV